MREAWCETIFLYLCGRFRTSQIKMEYIKTSIEGVWIIEPQVFKDARGYFMETWKQTDFDKNIGRHVEFVQDNESHS